MSDKKNYNRLALQGWDVDDMEVVSQYGLDPQLAYTPRLNDVLLEKAYKDNIKGYIGMGYSEGKAKAEAGRSKAQAMNEIKMLMN